MDVDDYIQMSERSIENTQRKIRQEIENYMKISEIKISDPSTLTRTTIHVKDKKGEYYNILGREEVEKSYEELSKGKIKGKASEQARKYAEVIYQPSTYMEMTLNSKSGGIATLKVLCTLPEHAQAFGNYWIGQTIESMTLDQQVADFKRKVKGLRVADVKLSDYNGDKATITSVTCEMTYA